MYQASNDTFKKSNLIKSIIQSYHKVESELRNFLKPYGITLQQYNVLKILKGAQKPLSTSVIRERMIEPMADTSRLVERLCTKGWVDRSACEKDKRLVDITISPEGVAFIENLTNMDHTLERLYSKLSPEEASTLNKLLNKIRT